MDARGTQEEVMLVEEQLPRGFRIITALDRERGIGIFAADDGMGWYGPRRDSPEEVVADARERHASCPQIYHARALLETASAMGTIEDGATFLIEPRYEDGGNPVGKHALLLSGIDAAVFRRTMLEHMGRDRDASARALRLLQLSDDELNDAFVAVLRRRTYTVAGMADAHWDALVPGLRELVTRADA